MLLYIHGKNLSITASLRAQVERKLDFALDRQDHRIRSIRVRFDDVNGPRGGPDKRCVIHVRGERGFEWRAEHTGDDTLIALHVAADRLERIIARHHERTTRRQRRPAA